jgi:hypothetical protein
MLNSESYHFICEMDASIALDPPKTLEGGSPMTNEAVIDGYVGFERDGHSS